MAIFCLVIDKDHIKKYPYCGSLEYSPETQSRAVNAEDAKHFYRWVVLIGRNNIQKNGQKKNTWCQGSVITERYLIQFMCLNDIFVLPLIFVRSSHFLS